MCAAFQDNSAAGIFRRLSAALADGSRDIKSVSREFASLKSCARVDFAHKLLGRYGLFPEVIERFKREKDAQELRQEGNSFFKIKNDELALIKYTDSIAHAPKGSESLGLAFANRSAVLYEHQLYKECLEDISNALSNNYPKHLHEKLQQRKDRAESLRSVQGSLIYHNELPTLTYGPNNLIECAGNCVEIKFEKHCGRHVVSTRDLEVGDVIAIEKPFSQILISKSYLTHCYHCLRPCYNLIACDNCPLVLFCGEDCKRSSWNSSHKYECPIMGTLLSLDVGSAMLVALKICMCVQHPLELDVVNPIYKSENYKEIHSLFANTEGRAPADLFARATTAAVIFELLKNYTRFFTDANEDRSNTFKELLLLHMQTGPLNFHEISELVRSNEDFYDPEEIGGGAYAFLSLLNHSCCPNVVRHCYGSSIVLRALRPIAKGEQLFDNYGYHHATQTKEIRQDQLKRQYYFECKCEACNDNWPLYQHLPEKHFNIGITSDDIINLLRQGNVEVAKTILPDLQTTAKTLESEIPCRELATVQEFLKQCYAIFANKRFSF